MDKYFMEVEAVRWDGTPESTAEISQWVDEETEGRQEAWEQEGIWTSGVHLEVSVPDAPTLWMGAGEWLVLLPYGEFTVIAEEDASILKDRIEQRPDLPEVCR